jgi:autotransporter-associated beta strand protein
MSAYTGATTISAGTLTIDVAGQLGGGNYAGLIANNTVLVYNSTAVQILSGTISGTGMLTNSGGGTLTLSASTNSYSGGTEVNNGIIYLKNDE